MKKSLSWVLVLMLVCSVFFSFAGCGKIAEKNKTKTVTVYYGNETSYTQTLNCANEAYLGINDIPLPSALESKYYVQGYYLNPEYSESFNGMRVATDLKIYVKITPLEPISNYVFGKEIDSNKVLDYFSSKGAYISVDNAWNYDMILALLYQEKGYGDSFYKIESEEIYNTVNRIRKVLYFPQTQRFVISFSTTSKKSLNNLAYAYEYEGTIEVQLRQNLSEAVYTGTYTQTCIDTRTYTYTAYYTAEFNFTPTKINPSEARFASFSSCQYSGQITDALDYSTAQKHFDKKGAGEKCYEKLNACFNFMDIVFEQIDSSYKSLE